MPERSTIMIASLTFLIMYLRWPIHRKILDHCRARASETTKPPEPTKDQSEPSSSSFTSSSNGCIGLPLKEDTNTTTTASSKEALRPSEYQTTLRGTIHVPRLGKERLQSEAATLRFLRRVSNFPSRRYMEHSILMTPSSLSQNTNKA